MSLSPSTSAASTPEFSTTCQICGTTPHGIHFGVLTCRACAAFFRRTIVTDRQFKYICRGGGEKCAISSTSRFSCKLCRFKKCERVGMTPDNVQLNRDSFTSKKKSENQEEKPFKRLSDSLLISQPKTIMDLTNLSVEIKKNAEHLPSYWNDPAYQKLNMLQKMEYALVEWRRNQKPVSKMRQLYKLTVRELFVIFENYMLECARWLSHFEHFQELSLDDKYRFVKSIWNIFRKMERTDLSVRTFGQKVVDEEVIVFSHEYIAVKSSMKIDYAEISDRPNDEISNMIHSTFLPLFETVAQPMIDIQPTITELVFMLGQLAWQLAGKTMQGKVLESSEIVKDELSNNLHEYYIKEMKQPNYASRLVRLMKIVNNAKKIQHGFQNMMELARIFDVFKIDFSEPDIFEK